MQCGPVQADHFEGWMVLVGGVVAAVIALAGVGLAGWIESRREATRRKHEDKVRFHDERLNAYIAYMAAATRLFAAAEVYATGGFTVMGGFATYASDEVGPYNAAFWRVSMLVKEPLSAHLRDVHAYVGRLTMDGQSQTDLAVIAERSQPARAAFFSAAKAELGIE